MPAIRWLHFSDLHVGQQEGTKWGTVDREFSADLERVHKLIKGPVDFIVFSGDLVFSGNPNEFTEFNQILGRFYKRIRDFQDKDPILLSVPGNHDLQRPDPKASAVKVLNSLWTKDPEVQETFWNDSSCDYRQVIQKSFSAYETWYRDAPFPKAPKTTSGLLPGDFASSIERDGATIGIVGLNTAFLQLTADPFEGRLAIDYYQLRELCGEYPDEWISKHDLCILVTHHPPSWLHKESLAAFNSEIARPGRFSFHLYGHLHTASGHTIRYGNVDTRRYIQAASLFGRPTWGEKGSQRIHGYAAALIQESRGNSSFRLWPRIAQTQASGKVSIVQDLSVGLEEDQGTAAEEIAEAFIRNKSKPKKEPEPTVTATPHSYDGVPKEYIFDYEKKIIQAYLESGGQLPNELVAKGCPRTWPIVRKRAPIDLTENPLEPENIGERRKEDEVVLVEARRSSDYLLYRQTLEELTFPEAGPREKMYFSSRYRDLRIGILVSGGIAPGINAVIDGIVDRHYKYADPWRTPNTTFLGTTAVRTQEHDVQVYGYLEGFKGVVGGTTRKMLDLDEVKANATLGGSMIGTSRVDLLLNYRDPGKRKDGLEAVTRRLSENLDILYIIGGDGSMRAAHGISTMSRALKDCPELTVVGIPKTMDNDILWVWQSFGFVSAVERARQIILQLHTEATSNPRLCVIQLFGSDSGFVVSHAVLGSGVCDLALLPEIPFTMRTISAYIKDKLQGRLKSRTTTHKVSPFGMIVMGETAIPTDYQDYIEDQDVGLSKDEKDAVKLFVEQGRRVHGQTPDDLRSASLKIVSRVLEKEIQKLSAGHGPNSEESYWRDFRVFTNEPRHVIRSMQPSVQDVILGQRLGVLAVDNAMAGYTDFMISQWLTEFVLVPLELVVVGRKRVPTKGIFWKSVVANTKQPFDLEKDYGE